jgi:hypothetical protein
MSDVTPNSQFVALKRRAPGKFSEKMVAALSEAVRTSQPKLELLSVDLGDDPFQEEISIVVRVCNEKSHSGGPKLTFAFTAESSVEDNILEFKEFIAERAEGASKSPKSEELKDRATAK